MGKYPNSGNLFRAKKRPSDKHPEYDGTAEIDGQEYRMAAWVQEARDGSKYFRIKFTPKDGQKTAGEENQAVSEDVPF